MEEDKELGRVLEIHDALREVTQLWVQSEDWEEERAQRLREEAVLLNHKRYFRSIPAYRALAEDAGIGEEIRDIEEASCSSEEGGRPLRARRWGRQSSLDWLTRPLV